VIAGVRACQPDSKSQAWEAVAARREQTKTWPDQGLNDLHRGVFTAPVRVADVSAEAE
jgi:hypothetical protein